MSKAKLYVKVEPVQALTRVMAIAVSYFCRLREIACLVIAHIYNSLLVWEFSIATFQHPFKVMQESLPVL